MPEAPAPRCCDAEPDLLAPEIARERLLAATGGPRGTQGVALHRAAGRILARDIVAPCALPGFDHAAMDGYALHAADLDGRYPPRLLRRIAAGDAAGVALAAGEAVRVLTGAPVLDGAAAVVMEEHARLAEGRVLLDAPVRLGQHIRRAGEDVATGMPLLAARRRIGARQMALLAALGIDAVEVHATPRMAVLSTGNELLKGAVRDSNRTMLLALLRGAGIEARDLGIAADDRDGLAEVLRRAAVEAELVIVTGGISGSDADHAVEAVSLAGGRAEVLRLAQKPGKPLGHGMIGAARCLLLPGNPVAALVGMLTLGLPMLAKLSGAAHGEAETMEVVLATTLRRSPGRTEYRPAQRVGVEPTGRFLVAPLGQGGSASLRPLAAADGLLRIPASPSLLVPGTRLAFLPFPEGC